MRLGKDQNLRNWYILHYLDLHTELVHTLLDRVGGGDGETRADGYVDWEPGVDHPWLTDRGWDMVKATRTAALGSWEFLYDLEGETTGGDDAEARSLLYDVTRFLAVAVAALKGMERDGHPEPHNVVWGLNSLMGDLRKRVQKAVSEHDEAESDRKGSPDLPAVGDAAHV